MKKSFIFIDGGNLYFRVKSIANYFSQEHKKEYGTLRFDYKSFCNSFIDETDLQGINYYVGKVKRPRDNKDSNDSGIQKHRSLYASQQRLDSYLKNDGINLKYGKLLQDPISKRYHEKGVDVQIAVDMIRLARLEMIDVAYLVSSDSDLIPAVEEVRSINGKEVVYIGVKKVASMDEQEAMMGQKKDPYCISFGLTKKASDYRILEKEQILPFLRQRS